MSVELSDLVTKVVGMATGGEEIEAYAAGRIGGGAPAWLSAANEVAVEAFLAGNLPWKSIPDVCEATLERHDGQVLADVDDVIEADRRARAVATGLLSRWSIR